MGNRRRSICIHLYLYRFAKHAGRHMRMRQRMNTTGSTACCSSVCVGGSGSYRSRTRTSGRSCRCASASNRIWQGHTHLRFKQVRLFDLNRRRLAKPEERKLRQCASTGEKNESTDSSSEFTKQLWKAARQGIETVEGADSNGSTDAFLSTEDKDVDAFFRETKRLYISRNIGQAANMYVDALENSAKYKLDSYVFSQSLTEDDAFQQKEASARAVCLFNCACCYAAFGELETAQQYVRDAASCNLDVKRLLSSKTNLSPAEPTPFANAVLSPVGSVQVLSQLRRFAESLIIENVAAKPRSKPSRKVNKDAIEDVEIIGLDSSIFGILRRLLILISVLSVIGGTLLLAGRLAWYS